MDALWLIILFMDIMAGFHPFGSELPSSEEASAEASELDKLGYVMKRHCNDQTDDEKAFWELLSNGLQDVRNCYREQAGVARVNFTTEDDHNYNSVCSLLKNATVCTDLLVEKFKPYMHDEEKMKIVQMIVDSFPRALERICTDAGPSFDKLYSELEQPGYNKCIQQLVLYLDGITNCTHDKWTSFQQCFQTGGIINCRFDLIMTCKEQTFRRLYELFFFLRHFFTPHVSFVKTGSLRGLPLKGSLTQTLKSAGIEW